MKFGRRAFLQFGAGVLGGTLLTPIPWKLAGDSARWTQNWPWEPSPERGEITKVSSVCLLCDGGCGIQVRLVNGNSGKRAIYIEGNPESPVNRGGICPLGASGLQFLYAPYRVEQPMKQTKARGDVSGFKPISWEDAGRELSTVLARLRTGAEGGGPQGLACITGRKQSSMYALWQQFFNAYGSPNLFSMPSETDSQEMAAYCMFGRRSPLAFALENASYVLSFGAGLLEGWGAHGRMLASGVTGTGGPAGRPAVELVQVEARFSGTASRADSGWVPVNPGTEAALALGIAHVIVRNGLYNKEFMEKRAFGFEDWIDPSGKEHKGFKRFVLEEYPPENVAELTGVSKERIEKLAVDFASKKGAVAVWGKDNGCAAGSIYHDLAFMTLNVLTGSFGPGGTMNLMPEVPLTPMPVVNADAIARQGLEKGRVDLLGKVRAPIPGNALHAFVDTVAGKGPYPIQALLVHEANPLYSLPENTLFKAALEKIDTVVSFSSYMDETACQADLILPNHCAFERYDDVTGIPGAPYACYAVAAPVLPPRLKTKHTGDLVLELAGDLGGSVKESLPWKSYEDFLKERVKGLAVATGGAVTGAGGKEPWKQAAGQSPERNFKDEKDLWKKLAGGSYWCDAPMDLMQHIATQSGDCELACQVLQKHGVMADKDSLYLPHFEPLTPPGSEKEYPFLLVSYRLPNVAAQYLPNPPFMNKTVPDTLLRGSDLFVDVNPKTAGPLGIAEGDRIMVGTPRGEVPVRAHIHPGARPGVIFIAQGFGHTAYDEYVRNKGVNANSVIDVQTDPVTGVGIVWASRAKIRKA